MMNRVRVHNPWRRPYVCMALLVVSQLASSPPARGAVPKKSKPIAGSFDDLAFMIGHWAGLNNSADIDELWTAPRGDTMMGVARVLQEDTTAYYAMQFFTLEKNTIVFRLVHLKPSLKRMPNPGEPLAMKLVALEKNQAVFEKPGRSRGGAARFTFQRIGKDKLVITLHTKQNGVFSEAGKYKYSLLP